MKIFTCSPHGPIIHSQGPHVLFNTMDDHGVTTTHHKINSGVGVSDGEWHHVSVAINGSHLTSVVDGGMVVVYSHTMESGVYYGGVCTIGGDGFIGL